MKAYILVGQTKFPVNDGYTLREAQLAMGQIGQDEGIIIINDKPGPKMGALVWAMVQPQDKPYAKNIGRILAMAIDRALLVPYDEAGQIAVVFADSRVGTETYFFDS